MMHPRVLFQVFLFARTSLASPLFSEGLPMAFYFFMESLILAQDERWRRA